MTQRQPSVGIPTVGLTAVRVIFGLFWLSQFSWKPPPTFGCPNEGFCLWVAKEIDHPLVPLYATMLRTVIQPNVIAFGWFTLLVETAIGISLIFGIGTRVGGLTGFFWSLNLLIGLLAVPGETWWYYVSLILLSFQFFALGDQLQFSLDREIDLPSWLTGISKNGPDNHASN